MSRERLAQRGLVPALALLSYALGLVQRPGEAFSDTRVELSLDPALFLSRVANVWSSTIDLGHVQSGQFVGYLFPMGPWFALGDELGMPTWLAQRLWLGTLLALAAWGVVRLMDALAGPERGVAHAGAALLFVLNPYVVVFVSRGTVTLLTYSALPWLMLVAHRGMRAPREWRWPAAAGLLAAAAGGGVNAAVLAFALLGPVALALYEVAVLGRRGRDALAFGWRAGLCVALASAWWAVPVLLQSGFGADFLRFTEQPGTIWGTTSLSELLRLHGFWLLYAGVGFGDPVPAMSIARTYLFDAPVVVATLGVPLAVVAGARLANTTT